MKQLSISLIIGLVLFSSAFCQTPIQSSVNPDPASGKTHKYSLSTTYLSLANFGEEKTNTQHYELHIKYDLGPKTRIGLKVATWKLFAPMGMPMQEQLEFDEENYYPGRLMESGIGLSYQRFFWKGLFATAEILPQLKTYLDEDGKQISNGFKLYTSYHLGYHVPLFKNRFFLEPQLHCQYWPVESKAPESFRKMDDKWNNYFLFEPNLYLGLNIAY